MSAVTTPPPPTTPPPQAPKTNRLGLTVKEYEGAASTLCTGCGHDSITERLVRSFFELGVEPHRVIKASGIGCSSKTTAYFLGRAHGINAVHGRMPSIVTGAKIANKHLMAVGVSGDGDTASIGLGQFCHLIRRNLDVTYVIENNGVYGLTKGQFSATADAGSTQKGGGANPFPAIDCCTLAIELGATFVARSFSGDAKQLLQILKAAIAHQGIAVVDVISPCVTFNDHEGSTKSYKYTREHDIPLHEVGFVPFFEKIAVEYEPGSTKDITLHDGSRLLLKKLGAEYDPTDKLRAIQTVEQASAEGKVLTGVYYVDPSKKEFTEILDLDETPLATLPQEKIRPPKTVLDKLMDQHR